LLPIPLHTGNEKLRYSHFLGGIGPPYTYKLLYLLPYTCWEV
jgi:hypothetical protein